MFRKTCPREYIIAFLVIITTHASRISAQMPYGVCSPCQNSKENNVGEYAVPCNLCPSTDCVECCSSCRNNYEPAADTQLEYVVVPLMGEQNSYDYSNPGNNVRHDNPNDNPTIGSDQNTLRTNTENLASETNIKPDTESTAMKPVDPEEDTEKITSRKHTSHKETPTTKDNKHSTIRKKKHTSTPMEMVTESSSKNNKDRTSTPMEKASEEETNNSIETSSSEKQSKVTTRSTTMDAYDDDDARRAGIDDDEIEVVRGLTPKNPSKRERNLPGKHQVTFTHTTRKPMYSNRMKQRHRHIKMVATESTVGIQTTTTSEPITTKEAYSYLAAAMEKPSNRNYDRESPVNEGEAPQVMSEYNDLVSLSLRKTLPLKDLYKETHRDVSEIRNQHKNIETYKETPENTQNDNAHKRITVIKSYHIVGSYPEEHSRVRELVPRESSQQRKLRKLPNYMDDFLKEPRLKLQSESRQFRALIDAERFVDRIKARHLKPIK